MIIEPVLNINKKYKRISIVIDSDQVELRLPSQRFLKQGLSFLNEKESYIIKKLKLNRIKQREYENYKFNFVVGDTIRLFDSLDLVIERQDDLRSYYKYDLERSILKVNLAKKLNLNQILEKFCREIAKQYFTEEVDKVTKTLNLKYNKISIKDTKTRWGSCSSNKNLSFNFRLVFAPKKVMEYLVIHEVCHLVYMNHSSDFWSLVKQVMPDYQVHNQWLKENGEILKMYFK